MGCVAVVNRAGPLLPRSRAAALKVVPDGISLRDVVRGAMDDHPVKSRCFAAPPSLLKPPKSHRDNPPDFRRAASAEGRPKKAQTVAKQAGLRKGNGKFGGELASTRNGPPPDGNGERNIAPQTRRQGGRASRTTTRVARSRTAIGGTCLRPVLRRPPHSELSEGPGEGGQDRFQ